METFTTTRQRIDWILVSSSLKFVRHEVLLDVDSDPHAVVAELKLEI